MAKKAVSSIARALYTLMSRNRVLHQRARSCFTSSERFVCPSSVPRLVRKAWQVKVHSGDSFAEYSDTEEVVYRSGSEINWGVQ